MTEVNRRMNIPSTSIKLLHRKGRPAREETGRRRSLGNDATPMNQRPWCWGSTLNSMFGHWFVAGLMLIVIYNPSRIHCSYRDAAVTLMMVEAFSVVHRNKPSLSPGTQQMRIPFSSGTKSWFTTVASKTIIYGNSKDNENGVENETVDKFTLLPSELVDSEGNQIEVLASTDLQDKRFGLYFASPINSPLCQELEFMLPQYMQALKESNQTISLIYVGCGSSASSYTLQDQLQRMKKIGCQLGVPVGSKSAMKLQREYQIWPTSDHEEFSSNNNDGDDMIIKEAPMNGKSTFDNTASTMDTVASVQYAVRPDVMDSSHAEGDEDDDTNGKDVSEEAESTEKFTPGKTETILRRSDLIQSLEGRSSGVPTIVVLNSRTGKELVTLATEQDGISALPEWPLDDPDGIW